MDETAALFPNAMRHEPELSERQRAVLDLVAAGRTNLAIAEELGISLDGAKWHVSEILTKLGFRTREEAAAYWRWRRSAPVRARLAVRGLVAGLGMKLAIGAAATAAIAGAAVLAILLTRVTRSEADAPPVTDAFVLEATIEGGPQGSPASALTWQYRDDAHWRFELQPLNAVPFARTMVADGASQWLYDSAFQPDAYFEAPIAGPAQPGQPLPVADPFDLSELGPVEAETPAEFAQSLARYGTVTPLGTATVLGLETLVFEVVSPGVQAGASTVNVTGVTRRYWLEPKRMFVLRMVADPGQPHELRHTVTRIGWDVAIPDATFVFTPPPGTVPDPCGVTAGLTEAPAGYYAIPAGVVPAPLEAASVNVERELGPRCSRVLAWFRRDPTAGRPGPGWLEIEQRQPGIELMPVPGGTTVPLGPDPAGTMRTGILVDQGGGVMSLHWHDGETGVVLRSDTLTGPELIAIAAAMERR